MADIKRFDPNWCQSFMEEDDRGNYVYAEDYESLEAEFTLIKQEYNVLRREYEKLQAGLKKLYLES